MNDKIMSIKTRFDGYLPVIIDLETGGVNPLKDALLELAAITVDYNDEGLLAPHDTFSTHINAFEGAHIDPAALAINKIDPDHPFRFAIDESEALAKLFDFTDAMIKKTGCRRAVLVGHNAHFDLSFLQMAIKRCQIKKYPYHAFTCFDTATLGGLVFGKTVLAKILRAADIKFDKNEAHSALYDTQKTAELFCLIVNQQDKHNE